MLPKWIKIFHTNRTPILVGIFVLTLFINSVFLLVTVIHNFTAYETEDTFISPTKLVSNTWNISGNKAFLSKEQHIAPDALKDKDMLQLTYNLHGLCLLPGDASAILFQQSNNQTAKVSLSKYGKNCSMQDQTVSIPFKDFSNFNPNNAIDFKTSFWYPTTYTVDIKHVIAYNSVLGTSTRRVRVARRRVTPTPTPTKKPTPTPSNTPTPSKVLTPTISPTATPSAGISISPTIASLLSSAPSPTIPVFIAPHPTWNIQSISSMKVTKDVICSQPDATFVQQWVNKAVELGANYISIEQPYDNPSCGDAIAYTKVWVNAIRAKGLHVWHRHMPLAFEGIYDATKNPNIDYIQIISSYIKANPSLFQAGDIFTPIPEPQNGGIQGITYCSQSICIFKGKADFNLWLRNAMTASEQAFQAIGLGGKLKIGYFGFDGFVTWGDNNPDWHGILEDATVAQMGNITIDHYPEIVGDTMDNDLNELQAKYPNTPIVIGEWGTITGTNISQQVQNSMGAAAKHKNIIGFNYWHAGPGPAASEALVLDNFVNNLQFADVQSFYNSTH